MCVGDPRKGRQPRPQAMPFDKSGGELIAHARLDTVGGVALFEPRFGASLDLVHCRAVWKNLGQPAQTLAETDLLIEPVSEARVSGCGGQRPELDGPERVDDELLVARLLGPEHRQKPPPS